MLVSSSQDLKIRTRTSVPKKFRTWGQRSSDNHLLLTGRWCVVSSPPNPSSFSRSPFGITRISTTKRIIAFLLPHRKPRPLPRNYLLPQKAVRMVRAVAGPRESLSHSGPVDWLTNAHSQPRYVAAVCVCLRIGRENPADPGLALAVEISRNPEPKWDLLDKFNFIELNLRSKGEMCLLGFKMLRAWAERTEEILFLCQNDCLRSWTTNSLYFSYERPCVGLSSYRRISGWFRVFY